MKAKDSRPGRKMWYKIPALTLWILIALVTTSRSQSAPTYPPTGKLVDAGGHLLHMHTMGKGKPVVVFENGSGDFSFIWDLVAAGTGKNHNYRFLYRAGYAWSEGGYPVRESKLPMNCTQPCTMPALRGHIFW